MPPPRIPLQTLLSRLRIHHSAIRPYPGGLQSSTANNGARKPLTTFSIVLRFAQIMLGYHIISKYIVSIGPTSGISMVPTIPHSYTSKPFILVSKLHRRGRNLKVGDVITYTHPLVPNAAACKRIIGMPGDVVCVMTPGKRDEDLEVEDDGERWASVKEEMFCVPEGHCWLAGDNLEWSRDSRLLGPVPLNLVKGKVMAVVWPWGERKWFGDGVVKRREGTEPDWVVTS